MKDLREEMHQVCDEFMTPGKGERLLSELEVTLVALFKQWALEMVGEDKKLPKDKEFMDYSLKEWEDYCLERTLKVSINRSKQEIRDRINNE